MSVASAGATHVEGRRQGEGRSLKGERKPEGASTVKGKRQVLEPKHTGDRRGQPHPRTRRHNPERRARRKDPSPSLGRSAAVPAEPRGQGRSKEAEPIRTDTADAGETASDRIPRLTRLVLRRETRERQIRRSESREAAPRARGTPGRSRKGPTVPQTQGLIHKNVNQKTGAGNGRRAE